MTDTAHLDFETYSPVDIKKAGGYKYAMDPRTEVLMASYGFSTGPVSLWVPAEGEPMPYDLREIFETALHTDDLIIKAFNAQFERLILWFCLKYQIPIENFRCVMVHAWSLSFSGGLDEVGRQLGISADKAKLAEGKKLIQRFCKPAPSNHKAERYDRHTHPAEWEKFKGYCIQDTVAEREIEHILAPYPMAERETELWFTDQRINDRGVPIDMNLVHSACKIERAEKTNLKKKLNQFTGLDNGSSPVQLKAWLTTQGLELPNMQKDTLEKALKEDIPPHLQPVLRLKLDAGKTSTTKWHAFERACCTDERLRGMFAFGGAQRTQRWAGRIVQLHNLKSPRIDSPDILAGFLVPGDRQLVEDLYGDVIGLLSDTIRCAITAPEGKMLSVSDLGSIESRVLGYVSNCIRINNIFAEGRDTYKDYAMELFHVDYDEVTSKQRKFSKPPTLGCFTAETRVLTKRGWSPIVDIRNQDELWDGIEWVKHEGVIPQGVKTVIKKAGVYATTDHLILTGLGQQWTSWKDLHGENIQRATQLVPGFLLNLTGTSGYASAPAEQLHGYLPLVLTEENLSPVYHVRTPDWQRRGLPQRTWEFLNKITIGLQTAFTQHVGGVRIRKIQITKATEDGVYNVGLEIRKKRSSISSGYQAGKTKLLNSIVSIMTNTTKKETFDSSIAQETQVTPELIETLNTSEGNILRHNSIGNSPANIEIKERWGGRSLLVKLLNKLSRSKKTVKAHTFDVLNAGPRNRFTILTEAGPMIAHNCGYQLGAKGLVEYADGMGVTMEPAEAKKAVDLFREIYPEVPAMWRWLIDSCKEVTQAPPGMCLEGYTVRIYRDQNFLFIDLPSGRRLAYYHPLVQMKTPPWEIDRIKEELEDLQFEYQCMGVEPEEYERLSREIQASAKQMPTLTYMGMNQFVHKWSRITTHGGKITENIVQAIARDILAYHMQIMEKENVEIVGHVHDEVIALAEVGTGGYMLKWMEEVMSNTPPWAPGLLLGADGFVTKRYKKE